MSFTLFGRVGACLLIVLGLAGLAPAAPAMPLEPAGRALGAVTQQSFPKWYGAMSRSWAHSGREEARCRQRMQRDCRLDLWQAFLGRLQGREPRMLLERVNRFVNRVPYRPDHLAWNRSDYWAAPGEFFARGGDCEDYAVAKYFSLRRLGIAPEAMHIVVVTDRVRKLAHAVLVVRDGDRQWLLDSLDDRIVDWRAQDRYSPIYAVNEEKAWAPWNADRTT
ncbi:MAG: transglutaminase-like cysteine peptidase [Kiloniellales bacterium]|nr:transglutaminase-like cysteine peptidase [Kiloniellales bacterium]